MLNFINYSDVAWIYPHRKKSDAFSIFQEWKALVKNESGEDIKLFCMDNGGDYSKHWNGVSSRMMMSGWSQQNCKHSTN